MLPLVSTARILSIVLGNIHDLHRVLLQMHYHCFLRWFTPRHPFSVTVGSVVNYTFLSNEHLIGFSVVFTNSL